MLDVTDEVKALYQADGTDKTLILMFYRDGESDPFLTISDTNYIMSESMEISESLTSEENLEYGDCEASQLKITLVDVEENLIGAHLFVYHVLGGLFPSEDLYPHGDDVYPAEGRYPSEDGIYPLYKWAETDEFIYPSGATVPLGKYIVQSAERQDNRHYRDITALDYMTLFDVNVTDWYNSLSFPMTVKTFRRSLCDYIGVSEVVNDNLPNDNLTVTKTIDPETLNGRDVLTACEQINGAFGHFDRRGRLNHIILMPNLGFYPREDLYPTEDLYPMSASDTNDQTGDETITQNLIVSMKYDDYTVQPIECVKIREEEGDIGAAYGSGNALIVEGNFLAYGFSTSDLQSIAAGIWSSVGKRPYIPYQADIKGLPYIEVGDNLLYEFDNDGTSLASYVISRTIKGISALRDSPVATGEEERSTENNINTQIIQLQGKSAVLKATIEEVSADLTDLANNTEAQFKITASEISAEVTRATSAENTLSSSITITAAEIRSEVSDTASNLQSQITQNANSITLKVSKGDVSSQLSVETGGITITGNRFTWTADNSSMTADGTLTCTNGNFSGKITATSGTIAGFTISGNELTAISDDTEIRFGDYYMNNSGCNFKEVEIDEDGLYIGSVGKNFTHIWESDTGTIYVNEMYIDQSWWDGWSVTETIEELWDYVYYGGWNPCGSDDGCYDCDSGDDGCDDCDGADCDSDGVECDIQ